MTRIWATVQQCSDESEFVVTSARFVDLKICASVRTNWKASIRNRAKESQSRFFQSFRPERNYLDQKPTSQAPRIHSNSSFPERITQLTFLYFHFYFSISCIFNISIALSFFFHPFCNKTNIFLRSDSCYVSLVSFSILGCLLFSPFSVWFPPRSFP